MMMNSIEEIIAEIIKKEYNKPCSQYVQDKLQQNIIVSIEDTINERAQFLQANKDLLYANLSNSTVNVFLADLLNELKKQKEKNTPAENPTPVIKINETPINNNSDVVNISDYRPNEANNNAVDVVTQVTEMPQFSLTRNKPGEVKYNYEEDDRINSVAGYASIVLLVLTSILLATYVIASIIGS